MKNYSLLVFIFAASVNALYSMEQSREIRKTLSFDDRSSDTIISLINASHAIMDKFLENEIATTDDIFQAMEQDQSWNSFLGVPQEQKNLVLHKITEHIGLSRYKEDHIAILCAVLAGAYSNDTIRYLFERQDLLLINFILGYRFNRNIHTAAIEQQSEPQLDDWLVVESTDLTESERCNYL